MARGPVLEGTGVREGYGEEDSRGGLGGRGGQVEEGVGKWATASESEHHITAMLKLARSEVSIPPEILDG